MTSVNCLNFSVVPSQGLCELNHCLNLMHVLIVWLNFADNESSKLNHQYIRKRQDESPGRSTDLIIFPPGIVNSHAQEKCIRHTFGTFSREKQPGWKVLVWTCVAFTKQSQTDKFSLGRIKQTAKHHALVWHKLEHGFLNYCWALVYQGTKKARASQAELILHKTTSSVGKVQTYCQEGTENGSLAATKPTLYLQFTRANTFQMICVSSPWFFPPFFPLLDLHLWLMDAGKGASSFLYFYFSHEWHLLFYLIRQPMHYCTITALLTNSILNK